MGCNSSGTKRKRRAWSAESEKSCQGIQKIRRGTRNPRATCPLIATHQSTHLSTPELSSPRYRMAFLTSSTAHCRPRTVPPVAKGHNDVWSAAGRHQHGGRRSAGSSSQPMGSCGCTIRTSKSTPSIGRSSNEETTTSEGHRRLVAVASQLNGCVGGIGRTSTSVTSLRRADVQVPSRLTSRAIFADCGKFVRVLGDTLMPTGKW